MASYRLIIYCALVSEDDVYIASATSDEPEDEVGTGDGETLYDILIAEDCRSIQLRKERQGEGNGRIYTIHLELDDGNGNVGTATCQVQVPHNNGVNAIDDGPAYEVAGHCFGKSSFAISKGIKQTELKVFPNPFKEKTTISFIIGEENIMSLIVYNIYRIEITRLFEGNAEADIEYLT